jgi:hypothetical protein
VSELVSVALADLARLVGVDPDSDRSTVESAMQLLISAHQARQSEARLRIEDRALVDAAVNDGRISADSATFWCEALKQDRCGNRPLLASLIPSQPAATDERI